MSDDRKMSATTPGPASTSRAATRKYQQIVVPDHALKPDTTGRSFLRTGTFPSLTDAAKQPPGFQKSLELAKLAGEHHLKTGGSWHHVDGNRVETTTGRKVEVIAGSYVAHRGPGNSPGPNFSATWATNSYTQIGSEDLPVGWTPGVQGSAATPPATPPSDPQTDFADSLSFPYSSSFDRAVPLGPDRDPKQEPTSSLDTTPPTGRKLPAQGDVASATWAQRTLTYVGSTNRPVPLVYAETWAGAFHSYSYYSQESRTYVGSSDSPGPVPFVLAQTHAGSVETKTFAHSGDIVTLNDAMAPTGIAWQDTKGASIRTTQEARADILITNLAPVMSTASVCGVIANASVAAAVANVVVGAAIGTVNVGSQLVVNVPDRLQFTLSDGHIVLASEEMSDVKQTLGTAVQHIALASNLMVAMQNEISQKNTQMSMDKTTIGLLLAMLHDCTTIGTG